MFYEILSGFRDKFQKRVSCVAFSIKFAKTNQKIAENSEICENWFIIIHYFSFVSLLAMRFATEAAISILRIDDLIKLQPPPEEQR